uniref:RNA-directed DNA polymerase n=1 Tax=Trichuris muris TaxID=70415 RepID=A0A5S6PYY1_TRIMR
MIKQLIVEVQGELPVTAKEIAKVTETDNVSRQARHFVLAGRPELSVSYGCLVWVIRTVIPAKLRTNVLDNLQETYPGKERMTSMGRQFCWWPGMNKDIEVKVHSCTACISVQKNPPKVAVKPWEVANGP